VEALKPAVRAGPPPILALCSKLEEVVESESRLPMLREEEAAES